MKRSPPLTPALIALLTCATAWGAEKVRITAIEFKAIVQDEKGEPTESEGKLQLKPLERVSHGLLITTIGLRIEESYTKEDLEARIEGDIERLYRKGEFERVGPREACIVEDFQGGKRVTIPVIEKWKVAVVYIKGGGPVGMDDLNLKTGRGRLVSDGDLRQDCETLLRRCHSKGYYFAEVTPNPDKKTKETARLMDVTFDISPGPYVRIYEIKFVGTKSVEAGELLDQMETKERDFWLLGLLRSGFFSPQKLVSDMDQLRRYMRGAKGLLDATAGIEDIAFDPERERMILTIRVEEGAVYTLKGFDINTSAAAGKPRFPAARLLAEAKAERLIAKPYRAVELENVKQTMVSKYHEDGYLNCRIHLEEPRVELQGNEATAVMRIEERDRVYARRIDIRGNDKTKDEVIRRELAFGPGDKVTLSKMQESVSNLHRLRFLAPESVDIRPIESTATAEGTDFLVEARDQNDGQLLMGIGLASDMGVMGSFAIKKHNFDILDWPSSFSDIPGSFTGAGQMLSLELAPGTTYSRYSLGFFEPYLINRWWGYSVGGSIYEARRDAWTEKNMGGDVRLHRYLTFDRKVFATLGYRYDLMEMSSIDKNAPKDAGEVVGTTQVSAMSVSLNVNDYLYDPYAGPYKGYRMRLSYEYAGGFLGADVDQWKAYAEGAYYLKLYEHEGGSKHILMTSADFGWMESHHNTPEVPIFERFFLGGPYSLRGFLPYGVGPHENGEEVGGTAILHGTVEYTFPLGVKFLRGVGFFDWGALEGPYWAEHVTRNDDNQKWNNHRLTMGRMRTSAGVGLRINLIPLGMPIPISLYWGEAISSRADDQERSFLFSIGQIGF